MIQQFVAEMHGEFKKEHRDLMDNTEMIREWTEGIYYEFPLLIFSAAVENWETDDHSLLTFKTPVLDCFELTAKKASCCSLHNNTDTGWFFRTGVLFLGSSSLCLSCI